METVYSLEGWVKEVIDNENAEILQRFNDNGMGEMGKRTLVEMAKSHFEFWRGYCKQLDTENKTAVYVHVYANVCPTACFAGKSMEACTGIWW